MPSSPRFRRLPRRLAYVLLVFTFCFSLDALGDDHDNVEDTDLSPGIRLRIESCGYRTTRIVLDDDDSAPVDDDDAADDDDATDDDDSAGDDDDSAGDDDDSAGDDDDSAAVNALPAAEITLPTNNTTVSINTDIAFLGSATDAEDGVLSGASLVWTSDVDGPLGTGVAITAQLTTVGAHVVTLTATDSGAGEGTDSINITAQ